MRNCLSEWTLVSENVAIVSFGNSLVEPGRQLGHVPRTSMARKCCLRADIVAIRRLQERQAFPGCISVFSRQAWRRETV